ncbi:hypothetical protein GCM10010431_46730 [Streptomyces kunmingensis]
MTTAARGAATGAELTGPAVSSSPPAHAAQVAATGNAVLITFVIPVEARDAAPGAGEVTPPPEAELPNCPT